MDTRTRDHTHLIDIANDRTIIHASKDLKAPGPRGHILLGHLLEFAHDPVQYLLEVADQFGDIARLRWCTLPVYLLTSPAYVQHVLQKNWRNYRKDIGYRVMKPLLGAGLLNSNGDYWLHQRRLIQPAFHRQHIATFSDMITSATAAMLDRWAASAEMGKSLDLATEMTQLTSGLMGQILFSADIHDQSLPLSRALALASHTSEAMLTASTQNLISLLSGAGILPFGPSQRVRRAITELDKTLYALIDKRHHEGLDHSDLLSMLMMEGEDGEGLSDRQVRDEILTIFLGGNETTGIALAWTWYLLCQHPIVEQRLRAELDQVLGERTPTYADLPKLSYTKMVLLEALRLYPPIWMTLRTVVHDDTLDGWHIPAGAAVIISPYVTHRRPSLWNDPDVFDPERFTPERAAGRQRYAYFPFGGGGRQCIGDNLALLTAQLVIAMVAQRYRLNLVPGAAITFDPMITLRPREGIQVTVTKKEHVQRS